MLLIGALRTQVKKPGSTRRKEPASNRPSGRDLLSPCQTERQSSKSLDLLFRTVYIWRDHIWRQRVCLIAI